MATDPLFEVRRAVGVACERHEPGARILIGVSGGADSLALAAVAAGLAERTGLRFGAVVVDHQLQAGSAAVAAAAAQQCRALGLDPVVEAHVHVQSGPGAGGLENAARLARRGVLLDAAQAHDAAAIWLAHTADDQAETVLLGLVRGSGARSLAGMRAQDGIWERPLLGMRRATLRAALVELGIEAYEDPHNADPRFTRVRVREAVLPVLERELGPHIVDNLVRTAELLRDDTTALDRLAEEWLAAHAELLLADLRELPRAIRTRVLRAAILAQGIPANGLTKDHIDAVDHLVTEPRTHGPVRLPGRLTAVKDRGLGRVEFQTG